MNEKIKEIADFYGYEAQSRQLIEEMAELTQAINKMWRCDEGLIFTDKPFDQGLIFTDKPLADVLEEIADVEICLDYVKYLIERKFGRREGMVDEKLNENKNFKIERELERMKNILQRRGREWRSLS